MTACAAATFAVSILAATSAPGAEDDRNAFQSAGLVNELAASLAAAEARIDQLETDMRAIAALVRDMHTNLAANQNQIERLRDSLNAAVARIIVLEAGNREWIEEVEARRRAHVRDLREARDRLANTPPGPTLNELFRVGEGSPARPAVGYDEVPLPD